MKTKKSVNEVYEIDEVVEVFGKYQIIQFLLVCSAATTIAMGNINYVFVVGEVDYRCRVPECDIGTEVEFKPDWWPNNTDRCMRPEYIEGGPYGDLPRDRCKNYSFVQSTEPCTDWIYETDESAMSTLNLACQPWKVGLIGTIRNVGMLVSMIIAGYISDRFGRKPAVILCVVGGVFGHLKPFTSSYYIYAFIEFVEALFIGGTNTGAMVLLIETANRKKRILAGVLFSCSLYIGEVLFGCIAMLATNWIVIIRIIYTPSVLFLCYIFILKESPRWLIINGKTDRAKKLIFNIAKTNKTPFKEQDILDVDAIKLKTKFDVKSYEKKESYHKIFKSKEVVKRLLVCAYARFTATFVYYGLVMNSVLLPGDKYTNFLLVTVMSLPGEFIALYSMNKIGRKLPCIIGFLLSGIMCILSGYTPAEYTTLQITLFLLGKMVISTCFTGSITYSMELFPTSTRGSLIGITAATSRFAGMLAPLTPLLSEISPKLALFLFGGSAVLASGLIFLMPETKGMPLMDTVDQVEESVKKKKCKRKDDSGANNPGFQDDVWSTDV